MQLYPWRDRCTAFFLAKRLFLPQEMFRECSLQPRSLAHFLTGVQPALPYF